MHSAPIVALSVLGDVLLSLGGDGKLAAWKIGAYTKPEVGCEGRYAPLQGGMGRCRKRGIAVCECVRGVLSGRQLLSSPSYDPAVREAVREAGRCCTVCQAGWGGIG